MARVKMNIGSKLFQNSSYAMTMIWPGQKKMPKP